MLDKAAPVSTVWHASVRREDGSWNHTVLVLPLDETPIGTGTGATCICDLADVDRKTASTNASRTAMADRRTDSGFMVLSHTGRMAKRRRRGVRFDARQARAS